MAMTIKVDVVSAEGEIFSGSANRVFAPAEMGDVGILPRHAPMLSKLKPGEVLVEMDGEDQHIFVSGGILEVQPSGVTVLADTAIRAKDLDEAAAEEAKQRAQEAMENASTDLDIAKAQIQMAESIAQLAMISKLRDKLSHQGLGR